MNGSYKFLCVLKSYDEQGEPTGLLAESWYEKLKGLWPRPVKLPILRLKRRSLAEFSELSSGSLRELNTPAAEQ